MAKDSAGNRKPWMRMWPRDFMADPEVQGLSWEQRGRYVWSLMCSWESDSPGVATEDQWRRWMQYSSAEWGGVHGEYAGLFKRSGGEWTQKRLRDEHLESKSASEHGKKAAHARWDARPMPNGCSGNAHDMPAVAYAVAVTEEPESKTGASPLELVSIRGESWTPSKKQESEFRSAYPGVDLELEFSRMRSWLLTNPLKQKTLRGLPRFANSWLSGASDRSKSVSQPNGEWYD